MGGGTEKRRRDWVEKKREGCRSGGLRSGDPTPSPWRSLLMKNSPALVSDESLVVQRFGFEFLVFFFCFAGEESKRCEDNDSVQRKGPFCLTLPLVLFFFILI